MEKIVLIFLFSWICFPKMVQSQESLVSGGGTAVTQAGMVAFTVGQIHFQSAEGNDLVLQGGVQQNIIFESTSIHSVIDSDLTVNVYPNPFDNFIWVDARWSETIYTWRILNLEGKVVHSGRFTDDLQFIDLSRLSTGTYLLHCTTESLKQFSCTLIKNN